MIVPDVNLLIYAADSSSPHHAPAARWWTGALNGAVVVGLPWSTILAFVRLITSPRVFVQPLNSGQALDAVQNWMSRPHVVALEATQRHLALVRGLLEGVGTAGNLVSDAHLAALAIEHGATLHSADADFSRFPGLKWVNPLID